MCICMRVCVCVSVCSSACVCVRLYVHVSVCILGTPLDARFDHSWVGVMVEQQEVAAAEKEMLYMTQAAGPGVDHARQAFFSSRL